jgi:hypothetical protein
MILICPLSLGFFYSLFLLSIPDSVGPSPLEDRIISHQPGLRDLNETVVIPSSQDSARISPNYSERIVSQTGRSTSTVIFGASSNTGQCGKFQRSQIRATSWINIGCAKRSRPSLSRPITKLSQCNYYYLAEHRYLIISCLDNFR